MNCDCTFFLGSSSIEDKKGICLEMDSLVEESKLLHEQLFELSIKT